MSIQNLETLLRGNSYPGRGIILGLSNDGKKSIVAYFIMGRSANSRNRIFVKTEDGIQTQAHDPSKMTDPSLVIYHPVRKCGDKLVITNGEHTDAICEALKAGHSYRHALVNFAFEPDAPNYTPRISGVVSADGSYVLSILKSAGGDPICCYRQFFEYDNPFAGHGHFIHTYRSDGSPLPSFSGEPILVTLGSPDAASLADRLWNVLDMHNRISLFVRYTDLATGEVEEVIRNKYEAK